MGGSPRSPPPQFGWATQPYTVAKVMVPRRKQVVPILSLALVAGGLVWLEETATPDDFEQPAHHDHVSGPRRAPMPANSPWPGYGIPAFVDYYAPGPPTRPELGRATWTFLHAVATNFPDNVTDTHIEAARDLVRAVSVLFPCSECAEHLRETLADMPVRANSAPEFKQFMCELHNVVNGRLDKPEFDCERVDERWQRSY